MVLEEEVSETSPLLSNDTFDGVSKTLSREVVQEVPEDEEIQYQGLPEVKKKLKYILPAITIGVSRRFSGTYLRQAVEHA